MLFQSCIMLRVPTQRGRICKRGFAARTTTDVYVNPFANLIQLYSCPKILRHIQSYKYYICNNTSVINGALVMNSDKTFSSPSTAADFCLGRSCNGWTIWQDNEGKTLDAVYRKQLE